MIMESTASGSRSAITCISSSRRRTSSRCIDSARRSIRTAPATPASRSRRHGSVSSRTPRRGATTRASSAWAQRSMRSACRFGRKKSGFRAAPSAAWRSPSASRNSKRSSATSRDLDGLLVMGGRTRSTSPIRWRAVSLGVSLESMSGIDECDPDGRAARGELRSRRSARPSRPKGLGARARYAGRDVDDRGHDRERCHGPRAHAFGPVKDAILGLEVVGGDSIATKCGGRWSRT